MSVYKLLVDTVDKMMSLKTNCPKIMNKYIPYICQQSYCDLFNAMFVIDMANVIKTNEDMKCDTLLFNEYINKVFNDYRIFKVNEEFILSGYHQKMLTYAEQLSIYTIKYLTEINKIFNDIEFNKFEYDNNDLYRTMLIFIPIYYELTHGSYNRYDMEERIYIMNDINTKCNFTDQHKINVEGTTNCMTYFACFKENKHVRKLFQGYVYIFNQIISYGTYEKLENKYVIENPEPVLTFYESKQTDNKTKPIKKITKNSLPKTIRSLVWDKYIGKEKGIGICYVCSNEINSKHFECGHVVARKCGGTDTADNLRPICSMCNKSVGAHNMDDFKLKHIK